MTHTPFSSVRTDELLIRSFRHLMHINTHRCEWCYLVCNRDDKCDTRYEFSLFTVFFSRCMFAPFNIYHSWASKQVSKRAIISIGIELRVICLFIFYFCFICEWDSVRFVAIRMLWEERIGIVSEIRKTIHDYVIMKIENKKYFNNANRWLRFLAHYCCYTGHSVFFLRIRESRASVFFHALFFIFCFSLLIAFNMQGNEL